MKHAVNPTAPAVSSALASLAGATHAILRIGTGLLFMQHGLQKMFGLVGGFMGPGHTAPLGSRFGLAGILELGGGLLLVFGLITRPVAFVLMVEMLVAFFTVHLPQGGAPLQNGGELPLLYALIFAFFVGHGAGPASVDAAIARRRPMELR